MKKKEKGGGGGREGDGRGGGEEEKKKSNNSSIKTHGPQSRKEIQSCNNRNTRISTILVPALDRYMDRWNRTDSSEINTPTEN